MKKLMEKFPCCMNLRKSAQSKFNTVSEELSSPICDIEVFLSEEMEKSEAKIEEKNDEKGEEKSKEITVIFTENDEKLLGTGTFSFTDLRSYTLKPNVLFDCNCNSPAAGFCITCKNKKYCEICYELQHTNEDSSHQYIPYCKVGKVRNSIVVNSKTFNKKMLILSKNI